MLNLNKLEYHHKYSIFILLILGLAFAGYVLYRPLWFKWQERVISGENTGRKREAVKSIAELESEAVPYLKGWLKSGKSDYIEAACKALILMQDDSWRRAIPELTELLEKPNSEITDEAAAVVFIKDYAVTKTRESDSSPYYDWEIEWKNYQDNKWIKTNICIYMVKKSYNRGFKYYGISELGRINARNSLDLLVSLLHDNATYMVPEYAAEALGDMADERAVEPLVEVLENSTHKNLLEACAKSLGDIGSNKATEVLLDKFSDSSDVFRDDKVQEALVYALCRINDDRAIEPMLEALKNDESVLARNNAAFSLGVTGNNRAAEPIAEAYENSRLLEEGAFALANFGNSERVIKVLEASQENNSFAALALAWIKGGEYLKNARSVKPNYDNRFFKKEVLAKWGDVDALWGVIKKLNHVEWYLEKFVMEIFATMPEGFPDYDYKANYFTRNLQANKIKEWYNQNKERLAWDADSRKYYLEPVKNK